MSVFDWMDEGCTCGELSDLFHGCPYCDGAIESAEYVNELENMLKELDEHLTADENQNPNTMAAVWTNDRFHRKIKHILEDK